MGIRKSLVVGENDLYTLRPDLMKDWDWGKNYKDPHYLQLSSNYMASWICSKCGHKWESRLDTRTKNGSGCPVCAKTRGHGSSIPDYTLYKLLELTFKGLHEVKYRSLVHGLEVDVFIPDLKICIEFDGYLWHSMPDKVYSDNYKDIYLSKNGFKVYRISDREDRLEVVEYLSATEASIPHVRHENYDYVKSAFAEILEEWGILQINNIPQEYWNLDRMGVKVLVEAPPYEKSFAYFLKSSGYKKLKWDFESNRFKPEDVYAKSSEIVNMVCDYGHKVSMKVGLITRSGYGCKYCSRAELKEGYNDIRVSAYNAYLTIPSIRGELSFNTLDKSIQTLDFVCPICGNVAEIYKSRLPFTKEYLKGCCCSSEVVEIIILGKFEGVIFYSCKVKGVYFLVLADEVKKDYLLDKISDTNDILDLPKSFEKIGPPTVFRLTMNNCYSLPFNSKNVKSVIIGNDTIDGVIDKLLEQRLKIDSGLELYKEVVDRYIPLTFKDISDYIAQRLVKEGYTVIPDDRKWWLRPAMSINGEVGLFITDNINKITGLKNSGYSNYMLITHISSEDFITVDYNVLDSNVSAYLEGIYSKVVRRLGIQSYESYLREFKNAIKPFLNYFNIIAPFSSVKKLKIVSEGDKVIFSISDTNVIVILNQDFEILDITGKYYKKYSHIFKNSRLSEELAALVKRLISAYKRPIHQVYFLNDLYLMQSIKISQSLSVEGEYDITIRTEPFTSRSSKSVI